MTKEEVQALIDLNIKTNSNLVSPTKTTGVMLKEVLVALNSITIEQEQYARTNPVPASDEGYADLFATDSNVYDYSNIDPETLLNGENGNLFMNLLRALSERVNDIDQGQSLSYTPSTSDLNLQNAGGSILDSQYLPILDVVEEKRSLTSGRQQLVFKTAVGETLDSVYIDSTNDIVFQGLLSSSTYDGADAGASIGQGYGIDIDGESGGELLTVRYGYNIDSASINHDSNRDQITINFDEDHTTNIYEISVVPVAGGWNTTVGGADWSFSQISEWGNRAASVGWAVADMEKSHCIIHINEFESDHQSLFFLVTGRRLRIHAG